MAAVFDLDTERDARTGGGDDELDQAHQLIVDHVRALDPHLALQLARRNKATWSAVETEAVAEMTKTSGDDRAAKRALDDGKTSKAAINKAAKRGAAAAANPGLVDKAAANDLSEEQMDVIAETADKTDGAAATGKHPRTNDQRKFDAAHELLCNITTTPALRPMPPTGTTTG